jgi:hypothetical protein
MVSVLYNNGDGTFQPPVNFAVGSSPEAVVLADTRGYGVLDIVTANYDSGTVSVLFNNYDGTFGPKQDYAAGRFPNSLAAVDVDGDGFPDLVTTNFLDHTVSVMRNHEDGTFGSPVAYNVGSVPSAVTGGDFNGDYYNDLAVANTNSNTISVLLNDGNWSGTGPGPGGGQSPGLSPVATELNYLLLASPVTPANPDSVSTKGSEDAIPVVPSTGEFISSPALGMDSSAVKPGSTVQPSLLSETSLQGLDGELSRDLRFDFSALQ